MSFNGGDIEIIWEDGAMFEYIKDITGENRHKDITHLYNRRCKNFKIKG